MRYIYFTIIFSAQILCANAQLEIPAGHFKVESSGTQRLIVCNVFPDPVPADISTISLDGETYEFSPAQTSLARGTFYEVVRESVTYRLVFSIVPIVDINVPGGAGTIGPDAEVSGSIVVTDTTEGSFSSKMRIKWRGASSLGFPKKSYRVQLRTDADDAWRHESIFGLRADRRWLMLSMYNEKLRLHNKASHDLWMDVHKLYYASEEPEARSGIRSRYVLGFINNRYMGVYLFTEDIDQKQYQLKEGINNADVEGELYKGENMGPPNQFTYSFAVFPDKPDAEDYSKEVWAGWELKHPGKSNWSNIYSFSEYVRETEKSVLQANIWDKLVMGNVMDYILFTNLVRATDNWGKNLFMARYQKGDPYFYGVWDLDGTWGFHWWGSRDDKVDDFRDNDLFRKILDGNSWFRNLLASRWFYLRGNIFSVPELRARLLGHYHYLKTNGVYEMEVVVQQRAGDWDLNWLTFGQEEIDYSLDWVDRRLAFLDQYLGNWWNGVLPVQLTSFEVAGSEAGHRLGWKTAEELDFLKFEVEHSRTGRIWEKVGVVPAIAGRQKEKSYLFDYPVREAGLHYYRLKMIDKDGTSAFSDILSARYGGKSQRTADDYPVRIFPNPANDLLFVETGHGAELNSAILYDLLGREVIRKETPGSAVTFDVGLLKGLHFIRFDYKDGYQNTRKVLIKGAF